MRQILEAAATLLTGLGLGAVYCWLGVLRRRMGAAEGAMLDAGFCLLFAGALFLLGMGPGGGTLRFYMPLLALGGGALWVRLFGRETRAASTRTLHLAGRVRRRTAAEWKKVEKICKVSEKNLKNIFSTVKKWFTIIGNSGRNVTNDSGTDRMESGESTHETEAIQYFYENRDPGADRLRGNLSGEHTEPHRTGEGRP